MGREVLDKIEVNATRAISGPLGNPYGGSAFNTEGDRLVYQSGGSEQVRSLSDLADRLTGRGSNRRVASFFKALESQGAGSVRDLNMMLSTLQTYINDADHRGIVRQLQVLNNAFLSAQQGSIISIYNASVAGESASNQGTSAEAILGGVVEQPSVSGALSQLVRNLISKEGSEALGDVWRVIEGYIVQNTLNRAQRQISTQRIESLLQRAEVQLYTAPDYRTRAEDYIDGITNGAIEIADGIDASFEKNRGSSNKKRGGARQAASWIVENRDLLRTIGNSTSNALSYQVDENLIQSQQQQLGMEIQQLLQQSRIWLAQLETLNVGGNFIRGQLQHRRWSLFAKETMASASLVCAAANEYNISLNVNNMTNQTPAQRFERIANLRGAIANVLSFNLSPDNMDPLGTGGLRTGQSTPVRTPQGAHGQVPPPNR